MTVIIGMPDIPGWKSLEFDPVRPRSDERMRGRRTESAIHSTPWWRATYQAPFLLKREYGLLDAFMMQAGDNGEVFRAFDPERPRPMAHDNGKPLTGVKAGGGAFAGLAVLQSIASAFQVTVSGLPSGFQLRVGDYVEFRMSATVVSLHRIMADAVASAGGVVTLQIRYALPLPLFTTAAVVNFEKPACLMQIDQGSWQGRKGRTERSPVFSAREVFP